MIDIVAVIISFLIISSIALYAIYKIDTKDNCEYWKEMEEQNVNK